MLYKLPLYAILWGSASEWGEALLRDWNKSTNEALQRVVSGRNGGNAPPSVQTGMALFRINNGKIVEQWDKLNPPQV